MMISLEEAKKAVLDFFNPEPEMVAIGDEYVIVDEDTRETPYGWIFHVNSRSFVETGEWKHMIIGLGPVIVEKSDGSVHPTGSVYSHITEIKWYEAQREPSILRGLIFNFNILLDDITGRKSNDYPIGVVERARQRQAGQESGINRPVKTSS
jgi:immunity protein 35 of polymorphic toxin system